MSAISSRTGRGALLALLAAGLLTASATAAELEAVCGTDYRFSPADFSDVALTGVFVTDIPDQSVGLLRCGDRLVRPGDAFCADALSTLRFTPAGDRRAEAVIGYLPVAEDGVGAAQVLKLQIASSKNEPPAAKDAALQTYKNIPNSGTLEATDPEGEALQFTLSSAPKRGTVDLAPDGTYTYTPAKNKVGKDSFTFTAVDPAGNVSQEATVAIEILKPTDKLTYGDMSGDPDQFEALWLHCAGLWSGETVAGVPCFGPDKPVTRGEFLVMAAKLTGLEPDETQLASGFADEQEAPAWMRPYIVSALRAGVISGASSDHGLVFRPDDDLTGAEAAVILRNILRLPEVQDAAAFPEDSTVPAWAETAVSALHDVGVELDSSACAGAVTRREAARLLYAVGQLCEDSSLF